MPDSQEISSSPNDIVPIKHPLQNEWDFWYFKQDKSKLWTDCLMNIANFSSVEDFWALYNHIEVPSKLDVFCDYNMFKRGIKPMWEDPRNKKGGRLMILVRKQGKNSRLDDLWLEILLCLIGEAFDEDSDQICGAVINIRPKVDRISVWTSDCKAETSIRKICATIKERTGLSGQVTYEVHNDGNSKTSQPLLQL